MDPVGAAQGPERRPTPTLNIALSSNNPFNPYRARSPRPSPGLESPSSVQSAPGNRPVSRNPFLSAFEQESLIQAGQNSQANQGSNQGTLVDMSSSTQTKTESPQKINFGPSAEELFRDLNLDGDSSKNDEKRLPDRPPPPYRAGTMPMNGSGHRPSGSHEDSDRRRRPNRPPGERSLLDSPERSERRERSERSERPERRRPRRNSESSLADKGSIGDDERRRRERRDRRRREEKDKDGKPRDRSHRSRRPGYVDLIDKMDVTGLYGSGLFHHDGPFDACNPHRNRKRDNRAPMQAFPANSANNALGGSGPINKNIDLERFHGVGAEGFTDYNKTAAEDSLKRPGAERSISFNPKERVEMVHGEESIGLGTSTFLEGAPASRTAIQRRESENEAAALQNAGLGRKKSLAQRIRGISQPKRYGEGISGYGGNGAAPRITSPQDRYGPTSPDAFSPLGGGEVQSAGGVGKSNTDRNPFFDDYDEAYEKKGTTIKIAEEQNRTAGGRARAPSSPMRGAGAALERRKTADSIGEEQPLQPKSSGGGFLSRVKSLKGGKRGKPERPLG